MSPSEGGSWPRAKGGNGRPPGGQKARAAGKAEAAAACVGRDGSEGSGRAGGDCGDNCSVQSAVNIKVLGRRQAVRL